MSINSSLWETQLCLGLEGLRVVEDAYRHVDLASNHSSSGNRGSRSRLKAPHHEPTYPDDPAPDLRTALAHRPIDRDRT
jgi:hypothetical protein